MSDFSKTSASTPTNASSNSENTINGFRLPDVSTLLQAVKLAAVEDRPIMMDYWVNSIEKKAIIGVRENKEKLLVKSEDEYTSPIGSIYKVGGEYIILTENSIYIVDAAINVRRIDSKL